MRSVVARERDAPGSQKASAPQRRGGELLVGQTVERFLEPVGVRALSFGERLEPVGDLGEALLASTLGHARVHVRVFVRLARDRSLQIGARVTKRQVRRRITALLEVFEMAVSVASFAFGSGAEHRRHVVLPFDVRLRREIEVAAVCLGFTRKCRLEIAVGFRAFELHDCLRVVGPGFRLALISGSSVNPGRCDVKRRRVQPEPRSARRDLLRERLAILMAEEIAGEFGERALIDVALEIDHRFERNPIVVPPPGIELGSLRGAQVYIAFAADQPEQEPYLFLPTVVAAPIPLEPPGRNLIAQPVSRPPQNLDMGGQQAHLFPQLPIHGLYRSFAELYSALRELPGVLLDALTPENLVAQVAENNADVRPVAVSIEHVQSSKSLSVPILS